MTHSLDPFMSALLKTAADKHGSGAVVVADWAKQQFGVGIPHLMLEYLMGLNVIPYPAIIELAGPPGSCKSAFLQYLMRVYLEQMFGAVMLETEGKMSGTLLNSILEDYAASAVIFPGLNTQELWQRTMTTVLKSYKKYYVDTLKQFQKGKGELARPLLMCLDSLGAAPSEDSVDAISKTGAAERTFPVEALKNSRYFAQLPTRLRDLPVTIMYTNHEMKKISEGTQFGFGGPVERSTKGGATPDFFCGIRLFFEQASKPVEVKKGVFQQNLSIEVYKNSFNQKGNKVSLTMEWNKEIDPETNTEIQHTRFLWGKALVNYLAPNAPGFKYDRESVKKFLTVTRQSDTKFSCKELGVSDENPEVLGNLIESNEELVNKLRPYLGIKKWNEYNGTPASSAVPEITEDDEE